MFKNDPSLKTKGEKITQPQKTKRKRENDVKILNVLHHHSPLSESPKNMFLNLIISVMAALGLNVSLHAKREIHIRIVVAVYLSRYFVTLM